MLRPLNMNRIPLVSPLERWVFRPLFFAAFWGILVPLYFISEMIDNTWKQ